MAANGQVHLAEEGYDLIHRDAELACHVVDAKLTQTNLLDALTTRRSGAACGRRIIVHGCTNAASETSVQNSDHRNRLAATHPSQLFRRKYFHSLNSARSQERHHLVQTIWRSVTRHQRQPELSPLCCIAHLLHSDDRQPSAKPESDETEGPLERSFQSLRTLPFRAACGGDVPCIRLRTFRAVVCARRVAPTALVRDGA
jgi:hypothetical protein